MAVSPWAVYAAAKNHLVSGDIDLDSDSFRLALYTSASNALDLVNLSTIGSVTNECAGPPYTAGGQPLVGVTWGVGVSARQQKFTSSPVVFSGPIGGIKFAVVSKTDGRLLCVSQLSASQFSLLAGVPLTISPVPTGIFTLA